MFNVCHNSTNCSECSYHEKRKGPRPNTTIPFLSLVKVCTNRKARYRKSEKTAEFSSFPGSGWPIPPSLILLLILYRLSTSQQPHFSPEDGSSMFLQNTYLPTSPHSITTQTNIFTTKQFFKELNFEKCSSYQER
jgi:hypothetical protein